jgi:ketosteroid isomerase-like protein
MSQENVELVRSVMEAFNGHDLKGWLSFLDPEFEFVDHGGAVAEESGSGIETARRLVEGWFETFPDFRAVTEELIDAGDQVVCVTHWQGTGAASGLPYSQRSAEVYTLRNDRIVHAELGFANKNEALEAAGLQG